MPDRPSKDNVINLDALRPSVERRKVRRGDRRHEPRYVCQERLFVQVQDCPPAPDLIGRTLPGWTVDISAHGLKFICEVALPQGAQLQLWVEIVGVPGKFHLSGEVRWSQIADVGRHAVGLRIDAAVAGTDASDWRRLFGVKR